MLSTHPPGRLTDFREAVMGSALGKLSQSETVCIFAAVKHGRSTTLLELRRKGSLAGYPNCCRISRDIRRFNKRIYLRIKLNPLLREGGDVGGTVVKVLFYKSECRWFDPSWCHWKFSLIYNLSDRTMALGSTQPLTDMSTRSISWW